MLSLFTKPLQQLGAEDVEELVAEGFPEGDRVEFKGRLPAPRGGQDAWIEGGSIGGYARDKILAEVVALATAHGGHLVLGISETRGKPARAEKIAPIPRCHDLAERLRLQARDCVEPQIPLLSSVGIETEADGSGVVLIRVGRSYAAPHRLTTTRHCYIRRADRTEKMTMREIQDLTLQTERGTQHIDAALARSHQSFSKLMRTEGEERATGLRVAIMPVWPLQVDRVYGNVDLFPHQRQHFLGIGETNVPIVVPWSPEPEKPILRGAERSRGIGTNRYVSYRLMCDGSGEIRLRLVHRGDDRPSLLPGWILGAAADALAMVDAFRAGAGAPGMEYVLEVEVADSHGRFILGSFFEDPFGDHVGDPVHSPLLLPRLSVGDPEEFSLVLKRLTNDLMNAVGLRDFDEDFTLTL